MGSTLGVTQDIMAVDDSMTLSDRYNHEQLESLAGAMKEAQYEQDKQMALDSGESVVEDDNTPGGFQRVGDVTSISPDFETPEARGKHYVYEIGTLEGTFDIREAGNDEGKVVFVAQPGLYVIERSDIMDPTLNWRRAVAGPFQSDQEIRAYIDAKIGNKEMASPGTKGSLDSLSEIIREELIRYRKMT